MIKAIFIDFYGTVVFEDGEIVKKISQIIYETGNAIDASQIDGYWWMRFKELFENAYGENFRTQRDLEMQSLKDTIEHFGSSADAIALSDTMFEYWVKPEIFGESKEFFEKCPVPIYIVSNIDTADIMKAIEFHGLKPAGVFTSEDAKSYKPRKELFELALNSTGLKAEEVIHIGDSLGSDVQGASSVGINAIWINRGGREVPEGVTAVGNLLEVLDNLTIKAIEQEEIDFPKRFATYEEKDYGILFYMEDNKDSYDGNHACIYPEKITDLGAVLNDIAAFYKKLGIRASIYHPFEKDYFQENEQILNAHGYTYTPEDDHRVMLLTAENQINTPKRLDIKVLNEWDERVATDILIPSGEPWEVDVTRKRIARDGAYLFVGYLDGKAVVYTDIHKSEHGNTRFDYIVTSKEHRGKSYASELLSFVIEYCKEHDFPVCWQWAGPSEHICYQAGFRETFTMEAGYATGPELT